MDLFDWQINIFRKIKTAYELLQNHTTYTLDKNTIITLDEKSKKEIAVADTIQECYKMLIINYLVALLGYKVNDKSSFVHNQFKGDSKVNEFCSENNIILKKLYFMRDKIYSHFDEDFVKDEKEFATNQDIETCIDFLDKLFIRYLKEKKDEI